MSAPKRQLNQPGSQGECPGGGNISVEEFKSARLRLRLVNISGKGNAEFKDPNGQGGAEQRAEQAALHRPAWRPAPSGSWLAWFE